MTLSDQEMPTVYINKHVENKKADTATSIVYEVTTEFGSTPVETEYYLKTSDSFETDAVADLLLQDSSLSINDSSLELLVDFTEESAIDMVLKLFKSEIYPNELSAEMVLFLYSSLVKGALNFKTHYRLNLGAITATRDMFTSLVLAEAKYFKLLSDVYCSSSGTLYNIPGDIRYQSGTIHPILADVYSTYLVETVVPAEIYIAQHALPGIVTDLQLAYGECTALLTDIYNSELATDSFGADFKTRSLFLAGFFLPIDSFTAASGIGYVDIVDYVYEINESTINIDKNGVAISELVIQDISKGKRIFFNPLDGFYDDGEIVVTVYAESVYGEVLEESFYLLYGYDLEFAEVGTYWGADNRVYITATASNDAVCTNKAGLHYYFDTAQYPSINLTAYINAVEYKDLFCSIYPRSTAFYYGQTYTVTVSGVKDFHGNQMEPCTYTFTIESP